MRRINVFEMSSIHRMPLTVTGFEFGRGQKSMAIVGGMRGDEVQQVYICSQIVKKLKAIEAEGGFTPGRSVQVIPCVNPYSINIHERFWAMDGTDINRMFPGYDKGETTQRIAAAVFNHIKDYERGVHFASYYLNGDFVTHVRMMKTDFADVEGARDFGLPYIIVRKPMPIDTTTLNYNWQIWDTHSYTILSRSGGKIDPASARVSVNAVLRYLARNEILKYSVDGGRLPEILHEEKLLTINAPAAGFYRPRLHLGDQVHQNEVMGEIIDPLEGKVVKQVVCHSSGTIFFACPEPLVMQRQVLYRVIPGLHGEYAF